MKPPFQSLPVVLALAQEAGRAISDIYHRPTSEQEIQYKADQSPVSLADRVAHHIIVKGLSASFPEIPIVSEESVLPAYDIRKKWSKYWLVDPLDGTKEFVARTGEFTVNIALIDNGVPVLGVIYVPEQSTLYWGYALGAFKQLEGHPPETIKVIQLEFPLLKGHPLKIVRSRRHDTEDLLSPQLQCCEATRVFVGSSLKFCWLAEGKADLYPRFGATSEWDTAAGHCILEAAGGCVVTRQGLPLRYNQQENIVQGDFVAGNNINLVKYLLSMCV